jgi:hypothetical protein
MFWLRHLLPYGPQRRNRRYSLTQCGPAPLSHRMSLSQSTWLPSGHDVSSNRNSVCSMAFLSCSPL